MRFTQWISLGFASAGDTDFARLFGADRAALSDRVEGEVRQKWLSRPLRLRLDRQIREIEAALVFHTLEEEVHRERGLAHGVGDALPAPRALPVARVIAVVLQQHHRRAASRCLRQLLVACAARVADDERLAREINRLNASIEHELRRSEARAVQQVVDARPGPPDLRDPATAAHATGYVDGVVAVGSDFQQVIRANLETRMHVDVAPLEAKRDRLEVREERSNEVTGQRVQRVDDVRNRAPPLRSPVPASERAGLILLCFGFTAIAAGLVFVVADVAVALETVARVFRLSTRGPRAWEGLSYAIALAALTFPLEYAFDAMVLEPRRRGEPGADRRYRRVVSAVVPLIVAAIALAAAMRFIFLRAEAVAEMAGPTDLITPLMDQHPVLIATALVVMTATFPVAGALCLGVGIHELGLFTTRTRASVRSVAGRTGHRFSLARAEFALGRARRAGARIREELAAVNGDLVRRTSQWNARKDYEVKLFIDGYTKGTRARALAGQDGQYDEAGDIAMSDYIRSACSCYLLANAEHGNGARNGRSPDKRRLTFTYDRNGR